MTPVKFWPKRAESQQCTWHHARLSPALAANDGQSGQTAPCLWTRERALSTGCVCTGLIMIWKNVWFPFYTLWITNRHSDPGWYLNNTEVCLLGTRMFPHQTGGLFAQQGLQHFGLPGVSPSADNKAILLLLYSVFTYFQTEYIPIVQATGKVKRPSIPRATVF